VRASTERTSLFLTYGGTGSFSHVTGRGYTYNEFDEPLATTFGIGAQQTLARHLTVRADAQAMTVLWVPIRGAGRGRGVDPAR